MTPDLGPVEQHVAELGLHLPEPLPPFGQYVPAVRSRDQLWVGGHFGTRSDGSIFTGTVGAEVDVDEARAAADSAARNLLSTVRAALGSLDDVEQVVRMFGVVSSTPDFHGQTHVIDAASDVLVAVFGERGRHARLAVGVASLPGDLVLEVEAVIDVRRRPEASGDGG